MGRVFQAVRPAHVKAAQVKWTRSEIQEIQSSQNKGIKQMHIRSKAAETGRVQAMEDFSS